MLQGQEILVILLVALVVLGPTRLPEVARKLGDWAAELRRAAREIRAGLEAEVGDVKGMADEIRRPLKEVTETMTDVREMMDESARPRRWVGPEPTRGPTSREAMADLERLEGRRPEGSRRRARPEQEEPEQGDGTDAGRDREGEDREEASTGREEAPTGREEPPPPRAADGTVG